MVQEVEDQNKEDENDITKMKSKKLKNRDKKRRQEEGSLRTRAVLFVDNTKDGGLARKLR